MDVLSTQAICLRVVRAPDHDDVDECHPAQKRYDTRSHDSVLAEQLFGPYVPPRQPDHDDSQGEAGTPP